jgi:hypothetical protein
MLNATKSGDTKVDLCAWIAMLGPPVVWLTYFEIIYTRVMPACATGTKLVLFIASILCLVLIGLCGFLAMPGLREPGERGARRFMAHVGLMTTSLFAMATIAQTIAIILVDPCLM